jgi:hypothetical protein
MLVVMGFSIMTIGLTTLSRYGNMENEMLQKTGLLVAVYTLLVSLLMFLVSPKLLISRSQSMKGQEKNFEKKEANARLLISITPGLVIMINALFYKESALIVSFMVSFSIILATILLLVAIPSFYLVGLFLTRPMPKILKSGSGFVIVKD